MSSTSRKPREGHDFYETPQWCVTRLLETGVLDGYRGHYLEPAAGRGAIVKAVDAHRASGPRPPVSWCLVEIDTQHVPALRTLKQELYVGDFTGSAPFDSAVYRGFDVAITNPPFDIAHAYIERLFSLEVKLAVLLLRLNFLASANRASFMRSNPPDVYVLPDRPKFVPGSGGDSIDYAWFVWRPQLLRSSGELRVLATTPLAERKPLT